MCGSGTFMPYMPVSTVSGMKIVAMIVSTFMTLFNWFETADRCASRMLGDPVLEEHRLVGQPHQVIVDVAEPVGQLLGDERKLAPRQPADRVALRQHDLPQRRDVALEVEDLPRQLRVRLLEHLVSSSSSRSCSLSTSGR